MCINKFLNASGYIELNSLIANKVLSVKPTDKIFCARRAWDQRAEAGYMKSIEDDFQALVIRVISNPEEIIFNEIDKILMNRYRARQNVVFEHGYLIGKLGRSRVAAVVKGQVDTPGDISGVVYIAMDEQENWKNDLKIEMRSVGYQV